MNIFTLLAAVKDDAHYQWGTVQKPFKATRRGKVYPFKKGDRVGVRLSSDKKSYRLVSEKLPTSFVFTFRLEPRITKLLNNRVNWAPFKGRQGGAKGDGVQDSLIKQQTVSRIPVGINAKAFQKYVLDALMSSGQRPSLALQEKNQSSYWSGLYNLAEDAFRGLAETVSDWYGGSGFTKIKERQIFVHFCTSVFTFDKGRHPVFRGTGLKEDMKIGYSFKLETSKKNFKLQSWTEDVRIAEGFMTEGSNSKTSYLLKSFIPARFMVAHHKHWDLLWKLLKSGVLDSAVDTFLDKIGANLDTPEARVTVKDMKKNLREIWQEICDDGGSHAESEVIVDFNSGFTPQCQVIVHE